MHETIKQFLQERDYSVLSVAQVDGAPYSAAMHFAYDEERNVLCFTTHNSTKKAQIFSATPLAKASVVIGTGHNKEMQEETLQMTGNLEKISDSALIDKAKRLIFTKHPEDRKFDREGMMHLVFKPSWWRYSYFGQEPPQIIEETIS